MDEIAVEDEESPTMTAEVYGVMQLHEWIGEANVRFDLDEDLFSLVVKRAAAYGWSSTLLQAGRELGGQRWEHADAGGDWAQDGRVRRLAWLTGYPAVDLPSQHLPVLPMTRILVEALHRVGRLEFTGLRIQAPLRLAPDIGFDLRTAADWFSLARLDSPVCMTAAIAAEPDLDAARLCELAVQRGYGRLRMKQAPDVEPALSPMDSLGPHAAGVGPGVSLECTAPEWSPESAAWIAEVLIDSLRACGLRTSAEITISHKTG
ncbi:hypothetical protein [Streptomyces sp. NPDC048442]|uniref:hypothetical protein n=1 Tax=Streptomyces sp. NPDC048442 TaxID=3154823 RepID=UPI00342CBE0F